MRENKEIYTSTFGNYEVSEGGISLVDIRNNKGELVCDKRFLDLSQIKHLSYILQPNDTITFVADSGIKSIEITHINFEKVTGYDK